jgi:hypothetical protein
MTLLVAAVACSASPRGAESSGSNALPAGALAMVGNNVITEDRVAAVARAENIAPVDAARLEVRDALFASGALARGFADAPAVRAAVRGRLARANLADLYALALREEPSDAEVAEGTARHFVDLDRPESFRVIHAVVTVDEQADALARAKARALAERISERVAKAATAEDFRRAVESVADRDGIQVIVEELKPVAADGRVIDLQHGSQTPATFVAPFASAAARLRNPGQKSGVVSTRFGFHVIMLLEKIPAHTVSLEERRASLRGELSSERAKQKRAELVTQLRAASSPTIERSAADLIATLKNVGIDTDETR